MQGMTYREGILTTVCCPEKALTCLAQKILQIACRHREVDTVDAGLTAEGSPYTDQRLWCKTTGKEWWDYIMQTWEEPVVAPEYPGEKGHIPEAVGEACPFTCSLKIRT